MAYTTIDDPTLYFSTTLWSGNSTDDRNIVVDGTGMQPDWVWIKERTNAGYHFTFDSVRGATKNLHTNTTQAESTQADALQTFNSNGFQIGTDGDINNSGDTYVSWSWKAGGTASSNTDGSITSSVSANTTAGFSIVSYTGTGANATVGHGLGVAPSMIIVKNRDNVDNWTVYHGTQGGTKVQWLNLTNATATESGWWNNTDPTSSVFYIGTQNGVNKSEDNLIAYCFAEKKGFSKFGSYTGNGSTDGTFVYTGFKPAFVLSKCTSLTAEDWNINDNKRPGYNVIQNALLPNSSSAEVTASYQAIDTLSNGFKWRGDNGRVNASGATYIYMAFAENPLFTSTGSPTTAR